MATAKSVASVRLYEAQGQGVIVTNDGEMVNWTGHGIGCTNGLRGASFRGARFYRTGSQKLARFNGLVAVFEVEIDNDGNVLEKFWQWRYRCILSWDDPMRPKSSLCQRVCNRECKKERVLTGRLGWIFISLIKWNRLSPDAS
jgi:hypothetical protein